MADPDQQDFDEFDTLVDDIADPADDLSFDKPDAGRKKRQTVFYVVLLAFIGLVLASVWFVFLRAPDESTSSQPIASVTDEQNATPPQVSSDLPPGVVQSPEDMAAANNSPVIDPATGQPVDAAATPEAAAEAGIVPIDPASVNPEVATPQIASPEVAAVDNAAPASATVSSTGTTVEALPPPIAAEETPAPVAAETAPNDVNVVPAAPEAVATPEAAAMAEPATLAPVAVAPVTETAAPVAASVPSDATNTAIDQRLSQIEEQVKSIAATPAAGTSSAASPELAAQLKALSDKLDTLATQVDSLDQRTTNFATELQNRGNDAAPAAAPKPVKKATPKPARKPVAKKPVASSWELRSAQPGVAWLGKPRSDEMLRFAVGQTAPGLGTIQDVSQEGGRWIVKTSGGTLRQ